MLKPLESNLKVNFGERTLGVFALGQKKDGSYAIIGMRNIKEGQFTSQSISEKVVPDQYDESVICKKISESSCMYANGGELFMINQANLNDAIEELRNRLIELAEKKHT